MKHTKAPWFAVQYGPFWNIQNGPYYENYHLFDEEKNPNAEADAKLGALAPELKEALQDYVKAQGQMLEKYSEGDDNVKQELWKALHTCEFKARNLLEKII